MRRLFGVEQIPLFVGIKRHPATDQIIDRLASVPAHDLDRFFVTKPRTRFERILDMQCDILFIDRNGNTALRVEGVAVPRILFADQQNIFLFTERRRGIESRDSRSDDDGIVNFVFKFHLCCDTSVFSGV